MSASSREGGYPLAAAIEVAEAEAEAARQAQAAALFTLDEGEARVARARARLDAHEERMLQDRSRSMGEQAPSRGAELERQAMHRLRLKSERKGFAETLRRAEETRDAAAVKVEDARRALLDAEARRGALERHHEGWRDEERRRAERREEDEVDERITAAMRRK